MSDPGGDDDFEILDFNPYSIPSGYLKAVGLVAMASAHTEAIVEMAIAACLGVDAEYGWAVTTHLNAPMRDNLLRSVAEIRVDDLDALDELDGLLDNIAAAYAPRNDHVHNQVAVRPNGGLLTVKTKARGRVETELLPAPIRKVKEDAAFIYQSGLALMEFLLKHNLEPALPPTARPRGHKSKAARKTRRKGSVGK